jgi:hypothetical protein
MGTMRTKRGLPKVFNQFRYFSRTATWRSGYAAVCKTVYPGSIPGVASRALIQNDNLELEAQSSPTLCEHSLMPFNTRVALLYAWARTEHVTLFPGSSAVEQPAVNRLVAGSNPARGANV